MNCHDFESMARDWTSGKLAGEGFAEGLDHASRCRACQILLSEERELTSLLAMLAQSSQVEAPHEIERELLQQFRRQAGKPVGPGHRIRFWALGTAAAMVVLLLTSAGGWYWHWRSALRPAEIEAGGPRAVIERSPAAPTISPAPARGPAPRSGLSSRHARSSRPAKAPARPPDEPPQSASPTYEVFSDFIALGDGAPPMEGGQLVRVQVPRAMLFSLGLPLDPGRAFEPIEAELVVGRDGMTRAIRFVNEGRIRRLGK